VRPIRLLTLFILVHILPFFVDDQRLKEYYIQAKIFDQKK